MMVKAWRCLMVTLLTMILVACAAPQRIAGPDGAFERTGRFAVNLQSDDAKPYAAQGGFSWWDNHNQLRLDLTNPVGGTVARVQVLANQAVIEFADGTVQRAETADSLLAELWGQNIPVSGLRYWMQGSPEPDYPVVDKKYDVANNLAGFKQAGWQVELGNYDQIGPRRIKLLRVDSQQRLRLQFVIQ